jgi:hypothetical protein
MPLNDINTLISLADLAQSLSPDRVMQLSINPSNVQILVEGDASSASNIYWNQDDIDLLVERMMVGPVEQEDALPMVQVLNAAGVRGLATRVTNNLGLQGFAMVEPGDALRTYEYSQIIDYSGHPETRQRLADMLGIAEEYVQSNPGDDAPPAPYNTDIVLIVGEDYQEQWAQVPESSASTSLPPTPAAVQEEEIPNLPPGCSPDF